LACGLREERLELIEGPQRCRGVPETNRSTGLRGSTTRSDGSGLRFKVAGSYSLTLVCVSSLKGRGRSSRCSGPGVRFWGVPGRSWACVTRSRCPGAAPAAQRGRTAWTLARMARYWPAAGDSGYRGMWLSGSVFMYAEDQRRGRGFGCRSSLRRAGGGMKRCGSGRAGSIKRATTPTSWWGS
jgi:hypothetical protein